MKWIDPELFLETLGFFSPCFRASCTLALLLKFWHDGKAFCWGSELFIPPKMAHRAHSYWMFMDVHGIKLIALRGLNWPNYILGLWDKSGSIWETHACNDMIDNSSWWVGRNWKVPEVRKFWEYTLPKFNMEPQNGPKHDSTGYGHCWLSLEFRGAYHPVQLVFDFFLRCANRRAWSCGASAHPPTKRLHLPSECPVIMTWGCCTQAALVLPSGNLT